MVQDCYCGLLTGWNQADFEECSVKIVMKNPVFLNTRNMLLYVLLLLLGCDLVRVKLNI